MNTTQQLLKVHTAFKTGKLIELLADKEIETEVKFSSQAIITAFTETNCEPFSRADIDFIKACKKSINLKMMMDSIIYLAKNNHKNEAISLNKQYQAMRKGIKSTFKGLIFYKGD